MIDRGEFWVCIASIVVAAFAMGVAFEQAIGWGWASPAILTALAGCARPTYSRYRAVRSLRMNYTWKGVWLWLKGRKRSTGKRGITMVLRHPDKVIAQSEATAEGVAT